MKTIAANLCALALALFAFAPLASAAGKPPELLSYQGYLVDADGVPLGTNETGDPLPANYDVVFRIYSASSGGTLLWAEEQTITVDNGYFSVLLGEGAASGSDPRPDLSEVFTGIGAGERFVGVSVRFQAGGEFSEILPRLRLLTSPYSFLSSQSRSVVNPDGQSLLTAEGDNVSVAGTLNVTGGLSTAGTLSAATLSGSGANLTNLDASQVSSGTIGDARLSGNVAKLDRAQTFAQRNVFSGGITLSDSTLFLRNPGDPNHGLVWRNIGDGGRDGPYLWGNRGGTLATANGRKALQWYDNGDVVVSGAVKGTAFRAGNDDYFVYFTQNPGNGPGQGNGRRVMIGGGGDSPYMNNGQMHTSYDGDSNWDFFSDARMKKEIQDAEPVLDRLLDIRLRRYQYKNQEGDKMHLGVIAQELEALFPDFVSTGPVDEDGNSYLMVAYTDIGLIALGGVQELEARHSAEIGALRAENEDLRRRLELLEESVEALLEKQ